MSRAIRPSIRLRRFRDYDEALGTSAGWVLAARSAAGGAPSAGVYGARRTARSWLMGSNPTPHATGGRMGERPHARDQHRLRPRGAGPVHAVPHPGRQNPGSDRPDAFPPVQIPRCGPGDRSRRWRWPRACHPGLPPAQAGRRDMATCQAPASPPASTSALWPYAGSRARLSRSASCGVTIGRKELPPGRTRREPPPAAPGGRDGPVGSGSPPERRPGTRRCA